MEHGDFSEIYDECEDRGCNEYPSDDEYGQRSHGDSANRER